MLMSSFSHVMYFLPMLMSCYILSVSLTIYARVWSWFTRLHHHQAPTEALRSYFASTHEGGVEMSAQISAHTFTMSRHFLQKCVYVIQRLEPSDFADFSTSCAHYTTNETLNKNKVSQKIPCTVETMSQANRTLIILFPLSKLLSETLII